MAHVSGCLELVDPGVVEERGELVAELVRGGGDPGLFAVPAPRAVSEIRVRDEVAVAQEEVIVRLAVRDRGD